MSEEELEQAILVEARVVATQPDDSLMALLQEAAERMTEERFNRIYDKAHQILKEALYEARNWKM